MDAVYTRSSRHNPCPVCGRTKDGDCRFNEQLVLCHTYTDQISDINGYKYVKPSECGTWGVFSPADLAVPTKSVKAEGRTDYIYTLNHDPIVRVARFDKGNGSKTFAQSRYENGRWVTGLKLEIKTKIHLYQHENFLVKRAIANGDPVLIVEGEGKVDRLLNLGIAATCSIGGSGKWRMYGYPNYLEDLNGAAVVLCPDRDVPGLEHCEDIAKDFPTAKWLYAFPHLNWKAEKLPKKGGLDISDWIREGATKPEILAAIGEKKYRLRYQRHHWQPSLAIVSLHPITA